MDLVSSRYQAQEQRGHRVSGATALEGVSLLKAGVSVIKYGRQGKPHPSTLKLTASEDVLTWEGKPGVTGMLGLSRDDRFLALAAVRELLVGRESAVFRSANWKDRLSVDKSVSGLPELSLSLVIDPMRHALSHGVRPEALFKEAGSARQSLDISFTDETQFGLVLSALRALLPADVESQPTLSMAMDKTTLSDEPRTEPEAVEASAATSDNTGASVGQVPTNLLDPFGHDPFQDDAADAGFGASQLGFSSSPPAPRSTQQHVAAPPVDFDPFGLGDLAAGASSQPKPSEQYDLSSLLGPSAGMAAAPAQPKAGPMDDLLGL
ncbi:hypothetical protein AB1Y20_021929 [Prymnesium parvum]|uniref:Uncharacterized protein n=1 Tax=Prymnesium parvum TaxID=97485 RepID=A0AB34JFM2_PRYPA